MKTSTALAISVLLTAAGCQTTMRVEDNRPQESTPKTAYAEPFGALRHVVAFRFKDDVSAETKQQVIERLRALEDEIPQIKAFEWGAEISGRNLNKELTHCVLFTFDNEADRDSYLQHPVHQEFVALIRPVTADLFVFDYWAQE